MTSPSYINRLCFFTAVCGSGFRLKLQSVAMMASSRKGLLEDEAEQSLLEELTASDQSSFSDDDDSSGTDDLTVVEVIGSGCSDNESDNVQCATASSAPTASSATFTWEDMRNYVGQRAVFQTAFISGDTNKTATIVLSLVEPLLKKGHTLWMENFYTSPALAQRLKSWKTDCVGTLRLVGKTFHKE